MMKQCQNGTQHANFNQSCMRIVLKGELKAAESAPQCLWEVPGKHFQIITSSVQRFEGVHKLTMQ